MSVLGPVLALIGVVVGGALSFIFAFVGESRRERWALRREWRERKLQAYSGYLADCKRLRDLAQRLAAGVGLDDQAPPLPRSENLEPLAEANMARSASFETVSLVGGKDVVEAGRRLNVALWRLEWFARGFLDDTDTVGWSEAMAGYFAAINDFHRCARCDLAVAGEFSPRTAETSPRILYERDRRLRDC
ncbi:hypothetical protein AB0M54_20915 [Actinoplanes sp. NPDC051470]|uniref:hypothetical protein n=1 Tax=unclassified Actinoplanes TaxID=2626549 RepID=UPI0034361684